MNIIVIGLGSMGKRRIRLIRDMYPDYKIWGIDKRTDRRGETKQLYNIDVYEDINQVRKNNEIDCAFVCTSPLSHASIIKECLNNNWDIFTEINIIDDGYRENISLSEEKSKLLFISSTFLYKEEIKFIKHKISEGGKWNYIYHVGQYLPDWHPWEKYEDFFISHKKTNGCREILAIELPWLLKVFGEIKCIHAIKDRNTNLNIDFNDNYMIQIEHQNGNKGSLIVDVVSPVAIRNFEAYRENEYISWNGTPETLKIFDKNLKQLKLVEENYSIERISGYANFIVENGYRNEINEFFDVLNGKREQNYTFEDDFKILKLINKLEEGN